MSGNPAQDVRRMDLHGLPNSAPGPILPDLLMPRLAGPTTLRHWRADPAATNVPVVFLAASPFAPRKPADQLKQALGATGAGPTRLS